MTQPRRAERLPIPSSPELTQLPPVQSYPEQEGVGGCSPNTCFPLLAPTPGPGDQLLPGTPCMARTVPGPSQCSPHRWPSMTYVPHSTAGDNLIAPSSSWLGAWFQAPGLLWVWRLCLLPPLSSSCPPGDTAHPVRATGTKQTSQQSKSNESFGFPGQRQAMCTCYTTANHRCMCLTGQCAPPQPRNTLPLKRQPSP